jgi:hypothetical protein
MRQTVSFIERLPVYHAQMRRFLIGLVVVLLLIASAAIGVAVARWPDLLQFWHTSGHH